MINQLSDIALEILTCKHIIDVALMSTSSDVDMESLAGTLYVVYKKLDDILKNINELI